MLTLSPLDRAKWDKLNFGHRTCPLIPSHRVCVGGPLKALKTVETRKHFYGRPNLANITYDKEIQFSSYINLFCIMRNKINVAFHFFLLTDGAQFFSLVKSLARRYGDNKKLNFLWVDPDPFPTVSCKCKRYRTAITALLLLLWLHYLLLYSINYLWNRYFWASPTSTRS